MDISEQERRKFHEDGYLALPNLLSQEEVEVARRALGELIEELITAAKSGQYTYTPPKWGQTGNYDGAWIKKPNSRMSVVFEHSFDPLAATVEEALGRVRNLYQHDDEHPVMKQLVESPRIKGAAAQLIGEEVTMFQTMALQKPALLGSEKPWHQDNAYFKHTPLEKIVGFWLALDDATAENGCMHVLPGWHRKGGFKHVHEEDCKIAPDRLRDIQPVAVELPAGGAMFFSSMLPHQTPPNRSNRPRRALQFHYRALSTREVQPEEYDRVFAEADGTPASCAAAARPTTTQ